MATKAQLLDALRVERDRLVDEADGFQVALDVSCSPAAIAAALLVPGIGPVMFGAARAACAFGSLVELQTRIDVAIGLAQQVETLADAVERSDPSDVATWAQLENAVRNIVNDKPSILDDVLSETVDAVDSVMDDLRKIPDLLPEVGIGIGAAAVGIALLFLVVTSRR